MTDTTDMPPTPSGRFVLRLPPALHARLKRTAQRTGVSLNDYCLHHLTAGEVRSTQFGGIVERAIEQSGDAVVGVVIFGSYARGNARPTSDIDVLIVLDQDVTRSLYSRWDEEPMSWSGHVVEPHLVRMPDPADPITGLWAEVAMEGAVMYDPSLRISRHLVRVRAAILNGELVRRAVDGQTYWTAA